MGRKKIQIQRITDERNKQVSVGPSFLASAYVLIFMVMRIFKCSQNVNICFLVFLQSLRDKNKNIVIDVYSLLKSDCVFFNKKANKQYYLLFIIFYRYHSEALE